MGFFFVLKFLYCNRNSKKTMEINLESLDLRRFNFTIKPPEEVKVMTINDNLILSRSNFALITGAPKVGKSTFTTIMIASFISNKKIFDIHLMPNKEKPKIALFDTEQATYDLYKSINRMIVLAQNYQPKNLDVFTLRKDDATTITKLLELYITTNLETGLIIIDGLLDLVYNFNDEKECKILIDFLKRVTAEYQIAIIGILHTGKTTGSTVGHIGSFADRYCQSNLEVFKEQNTINLKGKLLRSCGDFMPISVMRDEFGNLFQIGYEEPEINTVTKVVKKRPKR